MKTIFKELSYFNTQPVPMRRLLQTNLIYAFALPVIELFIGAYIIRSSRDYSLVMVYQLAQGTGIPLTFIVNGFLMRRINISWLYAIGMLLSGLSMGVMMLLGSLDMFGIAITGLLMGLAYGFFWANRVFLTLKTTDDQNRNYYYGLEALFFTAASIIMPLLAGYLISTTSKFGWLGGRAENAYYLLTGLVIALTLAAGLVIKSLPPVKPDRSRFLYLNFAPLWKKMLCMASLKGVAQGFVIAAPVMLIMRLVGNEGSLGAIQSVGAALSAVLLYVLGRKTAPKHRLKIFLAGLLLFLTGAVVNMLLFSAFSAIFFVGCLVFARPLLDLAYFPIQLGVIDCISAREQRNPFTYVFSHEVGLYAGRILGCLSFIIVARNISEDDALRYALVGVAMIQAVSIFVAKWITSDAEWCEAPADRPVSANALKEPAEL
jgi:YQGE family putative transporter